MSTVTKIEWSDRTWSPLLGCDKVSPGCDRCYAVRTVHRLASNPHPKIGPLYQGLTHQTPGGLDWTGAVRTIPERLTDPLSWRKPQRVFVNSQADLFHKDVPDEFITRVFAVMAMASQHQFQILTKRHARMRSVLSAPGFHDAVTRALLTNPVFCQPPRTPPWPLPNVYLGVSVEDQHWADIRIPTLLETPAAVRWISAEPLLGPIDLVGDDHAGHEREPDGTGGWFCVPCSGEGEDGYVTWFVRDRRIPLDWIVIGGESGPGARPMDLAWAQRIVDQCRAAGVPVLVKQLGTVTGGKTHHDIDTFPESLRVRQYPEVIR